MIFTLVKDIRWLLKEVSDRLLLKEKFKLDNGWRNDKGDGWLLVEKYPLVIEELLEGLCNEVKLVSRNIWGVDTDEK